MDRYELRETALFSARQACDTEVRANRSSVGVGGSANPLFLRLEECWEAVKRHRAEAKEAIDLQDYHRVGLSLMYISL